MNMTLNEVETLAAQHGIAFSVREKQAISAAQRAEIERMTEISKNSRESLIERFNRVYPVILAGIQNAGNVMLSVTATAAVNLGVPMILVTLLIVEHHRVESGIRLFDDTHFASFASWALVLLNLVVEFATHYIEAREGYERRRRARASLRVWYSNLMYRLGVGANWTEIQQSPAHDFIALARLTSVAIVVLALVGSMRAAIEQSSGVWHAALIAIVTNSTLIEISAWLGGLVFTFTAVIGVQLASRYVSVRAAALMSSLESSDSGDYSADADRAGAMVALAMLNQKLERKAAKARPDRALPPTNYDDDETQEATPAPLHSGR